MGVAGRSDAPHDGDRRAPGQAQPRARLRAIVGEVVVVPQSYRLDRVIAQLPLLDFLAFLTPGVFFGSLALAAGLIYALTILCSLYPGWLATQVQPAEALHYE